MRTTNPTRTVAVLAGVIGLAAMLTACSSDGTDQAKPTSTPSASSSASSSAGADPVFSTPPADIERSEATCVDGAVTVEASNQDVTVGDCPKVTVTASNSVIHLGVVDDLVVAGSINDVAAKSVTTVTVTGNGNRVTSDDTPKPKDSGEGNVFASR
jgi:hypothetical protein